MNKNPEEEPVAPLVPEESATEPMLTAPPDPASAEVNRLVYASLSNNEQEAYEAIVNTVQERGDLSLMSFLESVDAIISELSAGESASSEELQRQVDKLEELFTFGEGNLDIAIDMRPGTHMNNIEKLLLAILKKRWPADRTTSTKTEKAFGIAFSRPMRNILENTLPRYVLRKGVDMGPERDDAKKTIESILEKVRDARINSRRRFVQGAIAGTAGLAIAQTWLSSDTTDKNTPEKPLTTEAQIFASFDVEEQNRIAKITFDLPDNSGYKLNDTLSVYMGAPDATMEQVTVQKGTTEVSIPDKLVPEGGKIFFSIQLKKDGRKQVFHKDVIVEAK